jgi:tetratricopeptide (TPR) repeat protein
MVYARRQPRPGLAFNMLALACHLLASTTVTAGTLQDLLFEPQALNGAAPVTASVASAPLSLTAAAVPLPAAERGVAIGAYQRAIATLQETRGPFDAGLAEQYLALGRLYQEAADYDEALDIYAKAEHISRMNFGLHAPEQFLPIELSIDCHLAKGEFPEAVARQEYLVYLHHKHYGFDAAEAVPEVLALGDMYFTAFERGIHNDPGVLALKLGADAGVPDPGALTPVQAGFHWLNQARIQYFTSIRSLLAHEDYTNPLLLDLESNLIETLFMQAFRRSIEIDPQNFVNIREPGVRDMLTFDRTNEQLPLYRSGEEAFSRILVYLRNNPAVKPAQVAATMLELGDWHLLFGRETRSRAQYEAAREYLVASGADAAEIAALLNPAVPVQIPVFRDPPHSRASLASGTEHPAYAGYIDVALTLDRTGEVTRVEVLDKSVSADPAVEARLKKVLRNAPFRPRLAGMENSDKVAVRYNFAQL